MVHELSIDDLDQTQRQAFEELDDPSLVPARVLAEHKHLFEVVTSSGSGHARLTGAARKANIRPAVGDFVVLEPRDDASLIRGLLPRRSSLSRKVPGEVTAEQVLAVNIDFVVIVEPLDAGPNLRRVERYLTAAWQSGAQPVVALTKSDVADDSLQALSTVTDVAPGAEVVLTSVITGEGLDRLRALDRPGATLVVLGRSGAGKSSLINELSGDEVMPTRAVRADGKGRHTTTHRQMLSLPGGGSIIDTPGIRELQLWDASDTTDTTFPDIANLAGACRFNDCAHVTEPGCRVLEAVRDGELDPARLQSYRKQLREAAALGRKLDKRKAREESRRWSKIYKEAAARSRRR